jgi:hypothetical protein
MFRLGRKPIIHTRIFAYQCLEWLADYIVEARHSDIGMMGSAEGSPIQHFDRDPGMGQNGNGRPAGAPGVTEAESYRHRGATVHPRALGCG